MPTRRVPLITGNFYHIYNRAAHGLRPFTDHASALEFTKGLSYYAQFQPPVRLSQRGRLGKKRQEDYSDRLVDILAYCLMPTHFHLLVKQRRDNGITTYMRRLQNSFVRYYNTKLRKRGSLFERNFQNVLIASHEHLLHVSRYIHLNPTSAGLVKDPLEYPYSSLHLYKDNFFPLPFESSGVLTSYLNASEYLTFVTNNQDYQRELALIKTELLDSHTPGV